MVAQFCEHTRYHWLVHIKGILCVICELYSNKAVKIDISK